MTLEDDFFENDSSLVNITCRASKHWKFCFKAQLSAVVSRKFAGRSFVKNGGIRPIQVDRLYIVSLATPLDPGT
jgi:hypothetical protein